MASPEIDTGTFAVLNSAGLPVAWIHSVKDANQNGLEYWYYNAGLVCPAAVGGRETWTLERVALPLGMPDYQTWKSQPPQSGAATKKRHRIDGLV